MISSKWSLTKKQEGKIQDRSSVHGAWNVPGLIDINDAEKNAEHAKRHYIDFFQYLANYGLNGTLDLTNNTFTGGKQISIQYDRILDYTAPSIVDFFDVQYFTEQYIGVNHIWCTPWCTYLVYISRIIPHLLIYTTIIMITTHQGPMRLVVPDNSVPLNYELWALSFELWAMSYELWAVSYEL